MENRIPDEFIEKIMSTPQFQSLLRQNVDNTVDAMSEPEYRAAVQNSGSEESFYKKVTSYLFNKMLDLIWGKVIKPSALVASGLLMSGTTYTEDNIPESIPLDEIDWNKFDWDKFALADIDFDIQQVEVDTLINESFGEFAGSIFDWLEEFVDVV